MTNQLNPINIFNFEIIILNKRTWFFINNSSIMIIFDIFVDFLSNFLGQFHFEHFIGKLSFLIHKNYIKL